MSNMKIKRLTLLDVVPDIEKYWDYEKNNGKLPSDFTPNASAKIWTKCPICGTPILRTVRFTWTKDENGAGHVIHCRTCGKRNKNNSLVELYPSVKDYWVYDKNEHGPEHYTISSGKKVYIRCPKCGKERLLAICDAISKDNDGNYYVTACLECFKVQALHTKRQKDNNIKKAVPEIDLFWGMENIFQPEELTIFSREKIYTLCPTCGKVLYRSAFNSFYQDEHGVYHVMKCQKCASKKSNVQKALDRTGSVLIACPEVDEWWNYTLNATSPDQVTYGSHYEAYLHCPSCHKEFRRDLHSFIALHRDGKLLPVACPFCGYSSKGNPEDNLLKVCPEIADWWNYEKNYPFSPEQFTKGSQVKVYLTCPDCGIELYAGIHSLLYTKEDGTVGIRHEGLCRKYRAMNSDNNLVKNYPEVEQWWDYEKNPDKPDEYTIYSPHKAHFKCPKCGVETYRRISDAFILNQNGTPVLFDCPYCAGVKPIKGVNSLADLYPELAAQCISVADTSNIFPTSSSRVEWKCPDCDGTWHDLVVNRVNGSGCPYCENRWVLPGINSVNATNPELVSQWSPNNERSMDEFFPTSTYYALWICPDCGNEYSARINDRKFGDDACPYCTGRKALKGFNSLEDTNPELIDKWSPNNVRSMDEFLPTATYSALWLCPECGGEYSSSITDKVNENFSCPYCDDRKVLPGFNSFKIKHPELVKNEWAVIENMVIQLDPDEILDTSTKPAWWRCEECGQLYLMSVKERLLKQKRGHTPCTFCNGRRIRKRFNI